MIFPAIKLKCNCKKDMRNRITSICRKPFYPLFYLISMEQMFAGLCSLWGLK